MEIRGLGMVPWMEWQNDKGKCNSSWLALTDSGNTVD